MKLIVHLRPKRFDIYSVLALAGIVGPIVLVLTDTIASLYTPGYKPIQESGSQLAFGPMRWVQATGFILFGLLLVMFAMGLYSSIHKHAGLRASISIFMFFGFSLFIIGAIPTDPTGAPHTIHGIIHVGVAIVNTALSPITFFLIAPSLRADPRWENLFVYTVLTGVLATVFTVGRLFLPAELSWFGLYERILTAYSIIWLEAMAIRLLRLSQRDRLKP